MWRMASTGLDTLREVVVRSSQSGKLRVDLALLRRERQQMLEQLGAEVARLVEEGALEVPEELRAACERIREVQTRITADAEKAHDNAFGAPRGFEPEAGNFIVEPDEIDEHAEMAEAKPKKSR
jgi:hypothetical protein